MRFQDEKSTPLFCSNQVTSTKLDLPRIGTSVQIFQPEDEASATLIIVPGLHPFGIFDSRFQSFAESCAESGFLVVTLDVPEFRNFQVTPSAVNLISNLVGALPTFIPESSLRNVGLLGISYGGGPVLVAASRPDVKDRIHFVVSIGGYYNLLHAMEYSITGKYPGAGTLPPPDQWGRMIITLNHLQYLAPTPDIPALQEILTLRLNLNQSKAKEVEGSLTRAGKEFLSEVLNGFSAVEMSRYTKVLDLDSDISNELSPQTVIKNLSPQLRIYLLHGADDNSIPSYATQELDQALKKMKHQRLQSLITFSLNHVDPEKNDSWMDKMRLLLWARAFLDEAKSK